MKKFYQSLSLFSKIFFWTVVAHFLFIFSFFIHHLFVSSKPKKKIVVHQTTFKSEKKVSLSQPVARSVQSSSNVAVKADPKKVQKTVAKPIKKEPVTTKNKKTEVKKQDFEKAEVKKVNAELISKIQEECKQIAKAAQEPKNKGVASIAIPKLEEKPQEESSLEIRDFGQNLVSFLQALLELPEIGQVKVFLEIDTSGKIKKVEVLESQSKKNAQVLKKQLLDLDVSGLNDYRTLSKNYEYTITFKNDEKIF